MYPLHNTLMYYAYPSAEERERRRERNRERKLERVSEAEGLQKQRSFN